MADNFVTVDIESNLASVSSTKIFLASLCVLLLPVPVVFSQTKAPLRITVDKDQKTKQSIAQQGQARSSGNATHHTPQVLDRSREMVLNIKIQNLGGKPMSGLLVKYAVFGRDKETRAVRLAVEGEEKVDIKLLETKTVRTNPVEFDSQDVTYNQGAFSEMNRRAGKEYHGIAVTVFAGDDKIASFYNPPALEKLIEKLKQESK